MSAKLERFVLDTSGVRDLLRSSEVLECIKDEAVQRCPEGCVTDEYLGTNRWNVRIVTDTDEAYQDNLDNNTLLEVIS